MLRIADHPLVDDLYTIYHRFPSRQSKTNVAGGAPLRILTAQRPNLAHTQTTQVLNHSPLELNTLAEHKPPEVSTVISPTTHETLRLAMTREPVQKRITKHIATRRRSRHPLIPLRTSRRNTLDTAVIKNNRVPTHGLTIPTDVHKMPLDRCSAGVTDALLAIAVEAAGPHLPIQARVVQRGSKERQSSGSMPVSPASA